MAGNKNSGRVSVRHEKAFAEKQRQWREAIEVTKILKRLNSYALGLQEKGKPIEMTPQQVSVSLGLLKKALPDLQSSEVQLNVNPLADFYDIMAQTDNAPRGDGINRTNGHAGNGHAPD